jgi:hypothetical protein
MMTLLPIILSACYHNNIENMLFIKNTIGYHFCLCHNCWICYSLGCPYDAIICHDVINIDIRICLRNNPIITGRIFNKLGMDFMPLVTTLISYFRISYTLLF